MMTFTVHCGMLEVVYGIDYGCFPFMWRGRVIKNTSPTPIPTGGVQQISDCYDGALETGGGGWGWGVWGGGEGTQSRKGYRL